MGSDDDDDISNWESKSNVEERLKNVQVSKVFYFINLIANN